MLADQFCLILQIRKTTSTTITSYVKYKISSTKNIVW
jgi:hypothetical protein